MISRIPYPSGGHFLAAHEEGLLVLHSLIDAAIEWAERAVKLEEKKREG